MIEDSKELSVTFVNGTTLNAHIKGKDSQLDVAVIAVNLSDIDDETLKAIKIARLHGEEDLRVGQGVVAIGNALGYGQAVTVGVISALDRNIQASASDIRSGLIQVDAAINPGNSGGALLNMYGEVIGINVAKMADTEVEGMGYAIPIYKALDVINTLSEKEEVVDIADERQGRLGIYIDTVSAQSNMPGGVLISGFSDEEVQGGSTELKESPAKKAGLMKYDIITKFDGKEVKTAEELQGYCKASEAGSTVKLTYMRLENGEYKEYTADVVLGKKNDPVIRSTKKPEAEETKPEETAPQESAASDEGSGDGNEKKSYDQEIYDLFREFMEKYR